MNSTSPPISLSGPVRWAIVGTGNIAASFAGDIPAAGNAILEAVCSRTQGAAASFAQRFNIARIFTDIDSLAAATDIDAVIIASPNTAHFEQARSLILAGKHVLVEKPMVMSAHEARKLADLAKKQGVFAMEAVWTVFLPAIEEVRQRLKGNTIGHIRKVHAELAYRKTYDADSRFFSPALGGGSLFDLGIYPIALTRALFGKPQTIEGSWRAAPSGVDMSAEIRLGYGDFEARIACGFDRDGSNRLIIEGERGSIVTSAPLLRPQSIFIARNAVALGVVTRSGDGRLQNLIGKAAARVPFTGLNVWTGEIGGYGLQFEIAAASAAILSGRLEDERMSLAASIDALTIIETIKAQPPL